MTGVAGAEAWVLDAVRTYALDTSCPAPPADDAWLDTAAAARVLPVLLDHLVRCGHPLPERAGDWLYVGAATHLRSVVETRAVAAALEGSGVRWVVLKGPVLAEVMYRRPSLRPYSDLDVLVHPDDLGAALDALEDAGFRVLDRNWTLLADRSRGEMSLRTPAGTMLDLHWHLIAEQSVRRRFRLDVRRLVEARTTVDIRGVVVPTLQPLHTIVHLALHGSLSGGHRLLWLLDLQQALRWSQASADDLGHAAQEHGALLVLRTMVQRVAEYVDPGLWPLAERLGPSSHWSRLSALVSRRVPPLRDDGGRHTGRVVFSATGSGTPGSVAQLLRALPVATWNRLTSRDSAASFALLRTEAGDLADRRRWIAGAAAERPAPGPFANGATP